MTSQVIKKSRDYNVVQITSKDRTRFLIDAETPHGLSDACNFVSRNHPKAEQVYQTSQSAEYLLQE